MESRLGEKNVSLTRPHVRGTVENENASREQYILFFDWPCRYFEVIRGPRAGPRRRCRIRDLIPWFWFETALLLSLSSDVGEEPWVGWGGAGVAVGIWRQCLVARACHGDRLTPHTECTPLTPPQPRPPARPRHPPRCPLETSVLETPAHSGIHTYTCRKTRLYLN